MRALLLALGTLASAQQVPDLTYAPPLPRPAYKPGAGPRVAVDAAHHNFHTAVERYRPFAELLRRDGYRVESLDRTLSAESLEGLDVLVIANALHPRNVDDWSLPTPSAFEPGEVRALKAWVEQGGALLPLGKGRVAVFGEAAMFTAQLAGPNRVQVGMNAPEAAGNHQLLLNTLHWLTRLPGLQD